MSPRDAQRPYALDRLLDAVGMSSGELGAHVFASGSTVRRVGAEGLTEEQADTWACRLGLHPALVWPEWFATAPPP